MQGFPFPAVDGIGLPAPVWLFKLLHIALLGLHFALVQFMLGALCCAALWELRGRRSGNQALLSGSRQLGRMMPTVMTFLINLGVPPLLFAQVLYGSAIYVSSILIGAWWISVIGLLLVMYALIYWGQARAGEARPWAGFAGLALLLGLVIAAIYSTNMTLMLRPDVWGEMYRQNATGTALPFGDSSIWPRWAFMLCGGLLTAGLGLIMLGAPTLRSGALRQVMLREGGLLVLLGAVGQCGFALLVMRNLQEGVAADLRGHTLSALGMVLWLVLWAAAVVVGLLGYASAPKGAAGVRLKHLQIAAPAVAALLSIVMATVRDGIRDLTLKRAGFDVWTAFDLAPNWGILGIFLVLVVVALVIVGGLVVLALKTRPIEEAPSHE
ncbi:MAG: hypothetical protein IT204_16125 [Fimbriimonadaceae bacterium]|nr:hypothetical protein [Fimbriimonadaceae bacterium]